MTTVIEATGLCKRYQLKHQSGEAYSTLRDTIAGAFAQLARGVGLLRRAHDPVMEARKIDEFWALRDVDFTVREGDRLAVIGRNGAGKSTLLKILSRITEPSAGRVSIRGRVASLLEVGTGFHPELTGRENIFLNGAILGMSRARLVSKFDEIVAFAEVERFLDTPVKHYSSGMYVRLAFAVAAHLDPEILIVDEVLAVGDVHFQNKCLGKMESIGHEGRTLIFVSHNMGAVERLCTSAMVLAGGRVDRASNDVPSVIRAYLSGSERVFASEWINPASDFDGEFIRPVRFRLEDRAGKPKAPPFRHDDEIWVSIEVLVRKTDALLNLGYAMYTEAGELLYWSYHTDSEESEWPALSPGICVLRSMLPKEFLNEGNYRLELLAGLHARQWILEPGQSVPVIWLGVKGGLGKSPYWTERRPGLLGPVVKWHRAK